MLNITGEETRYVVYQEKPEVRDGASVAVPLIYNSYNGGFSEAGDILSATLFKEEDEAVELATLQNKISQILKQSFNYIVIKRVETREAIYSGKETEEPEVPEEPTEEPTE